MNLEHAVALQPLDLRTTNNIRQLVDAMSRCSFGARMFSESIKKIDMWIQEFRATHEQSSGVVIIHDSQMNSSMLTYLEKAFASRGLCRVMMSREFIHTPGHCRNVKLIIAGAYDPSHEELLASKQAIFVNEYGMVPKGHISDGCFRDMVVVDPAFFFPVLERYVCASEDTLSEVIDYAAQLANHYNLGQYGLSHSLQSARNTLYDMIVDPECMVFMTASGAMTIAQMGLLFCDMIEERMIQSLTTTGAMIAHGLAENIGLKHYKHDPSMSDDELAEALINRVTDTWEPESNLNHVEDILRRVLASIKDRTVLTPSVLYKYVGAYLIKHHPNWRGIVSSAYKHRVPIFNPAFVDSEVGNDLFVHNERRKRGMDINGNNTGRVRPKLIMDLERDTWKRLSLKMKSKQLGIFSIGGGVPRNNDQNDAPLIEILNGRVGLELPVPTFNYGVRIAPDPMYYGHLSGCTYSEGKSWRKMDPHGQFAEVQADATIVWPFILRSIMEKLRLT
ncbi:MAG: deoxyhypusine synthase family protein [bacterium]|nr:deoxyhypusine synthase family protein [bacterium]